MKKTRHATAVALTVALMLVLSLLVPTPDADARPTDDQRSATIVTKTVNGGDGESGCPKGALGTAGGCYVIESKVLVLTFDNVWMYTCPSGTVEDSLGQCRRPVADA